MLDCLTLTEDLAGMRSQTLGLTDALGLAPRQLTLPPRRLWLAPRLPLPPEPLVIGCGGKPAPVLAAWRRPGKLAVQIQHPRMDPRRFHQLVVARHDELVGPNVIVTRTALHRVTPARLAQAQAEWAPRLAHLPRPLVAVLVGGSNGRFRLGAAEGVALAGQLAAMMQADRAGLALTTSRRTAPAVQSALRSTLEPRGAWLWDGQGANPYFGLLACADAIIVTIDSVSMVSEAVATPHPVLLAALPGRSRRIGTFLHGLHTDGRVRPFAGRLELWPAAPLDDTAQAADTLRRRLGF